MTATLPPQLARLIRHDVQGMHAYAVQPSAGLVKLDAMENPHRLPPELQRALGERLASVALNRYPGERVATLRDALARHAGMPEGFSLMLGNGSDELISLLAMACDVPGASILAPMPGFVMYGMSAQLQGLKFIPVDLTPDFELDERAMLAAIEQHQPSIVYLAYPNNPTANLWDDVVIERIVQAAPGLVVIDEARRRFHDALDHRVVPQVGGGIVRIGQVDDSRLVLLDGGEHGALVQFEVGREVHRDELQSLQLGAHAVHHEAGHGREDGSAGHVAGHGQQRDQLVGAVAQHQREALGHAGVARERFTQRGDALARVAVQRHGCEPLAQRALQLGRQPVRVLHRVELDHAGRRLDGVGVHALHVVADQARQLRRQGSGHGLSLISAARACACRPSPCASTEATRPSDCAPASLTSIRLLRFWKSYTPSGLEKRAVLLVGST